MLTLCLHDFKFIAGEMGREYRTRDEVVNDQVFKYYILIALPTQQRIYRWWYIRLIIQSISNHIVYSTDR